MILYPGENSWNTVRLDKRNYTSQKAKEQQKELIKRIPEQYIYIDDKCRQNEGSNTFASMQNNWKTGF